MSTKWLGDTGVNNSPYARLAGSYTLTPTYWTDNNITVDTGAYTLTIIGHTLVLGDQVIFTFQKNRANTSIPNNIIAGKIYYVRQLNGNTFRIGSTNDDLNLINMTLQGTAGTWRLEKATGINSITLNNLNISNTARLVIRNGGFNANYPAINYQINGVTDSDAYYYCHTSASGLGSSYYSHHTGNSYPIIMSGLLEISCRNNIITMFQHIGWEGCDKTTSGSNTTVAQSGSYCITKKDIRFNKINSITFYVPSANFFGDMVVEVYEI